MAAFWTLNFLHSILQILISVFETVRVENFLFSLIEWYERLPLKVRVTSIESPTFISLSALLNSDSRPDLDGTGIPCSIFILSICKTIAYYHNNGQ